MSKQVNFNAVNAKSKAMLGKRLFENDYNELMKKKSVNEVAAYLKNNTSYYEILSKINETQVHRGQLEKQLKKLIFREFKKLLHYTEGTVKSFLKLTLIRYEVELLKLIVRFINSSMTSEFAPDIEYYSEIIKSLDIQRLKNAKNYSELLDALKSTSYYAILKRFETENDLDIFGIETALDMHYMSTMWKNKDLYLTGQDNDYVTNSLGTETDLLNIMCILRAKTYYSPVNELIYGLIIPYHYKLKRDMLIKLVEAKTVDDCFEIINKTPYSKIFNKNENKYWEQNYLELVYNINKAGIKATNSIGCILSYIHLKEIEIRNIVIIIEGIRYNLSSEDIKKYIVGVI